MAHPWFAFYPADYRAKTSGLTMLQDGAYRRLMDEYYLTGEPLPANADELLRICRAFADDEKAAVRYVLHKYFVEDDDGWHHLRIDEEIIKRAELSQKRAFAGGKGASKTNGKKSANGQQTERQLPTQLHSQSLEKENTSDKSDPSEPEPKPEKRKTPYPEAFEAFWREYPTDALMSKKATLACWHRLDPESRDAARAALPAFKAYCHKNPTYRPVHAQRFLSDRRFDGFLSAAVPFEPANEETWARRIVVWREKQMWSAKWGPKPDAPDCKCPPEILRDAA